MHDSFTSLLVASIRSPLRELNSGQWELFASLQPGNGIKLAMFRKARIELL
jgi:hypothetical protein